MPVPDPYYTVRIVGNIFFMGYQHYCIARLMYLPEQLHDLYRCFAIQVTRRLICKQQ